jgi:putative endonuclease
MGMADSTNVFHLHPKSVKYGKTYVGSSGNVDRRLKEHNSGKMSYSCRYKPWAVVKTEEFSTLIKARRREKYLKSGAGRRYLKTLIKF